MGEVSEMTVQETLEQDASPPVVIHESPVPDQLWALLRQIVPPIVAFCVGRGIIDDNMGALILSLFAVVAPIVWGQLKTRLRAMQLANLEKRVSDNLLTTKAKAKV